MQEIFKLDLSKPLTADMLSQLKSNYEVYKIGIDKVFEKGTEPPRVKVVEQSIDPLTGMLVKSDSDNVFDILNMNLIKIKNVITSKEQLELVSIFCEDVVRKYKLKPRQKMKLFNAFVAIIEKLDAIYFETGDRESILFDVDCETESDVEYAFEEFVESEADTFLFYKNYVKNLEEFTQYFKVKKDTIQRVYDSMYLAGY